MDFKEVYCDDRFEVNIDGIIINKKNKRIKSQYIGSTGYYMVTFSQNNKSKPKRVHKIIAEAFIENPKKLPFINHKDGNKLNNSIENLEWCNHSHNMRHAYETGLINNTGVKNGSSKLTVEKVLIIKKMLLMGISQYKIAKEIGGISRSAILKIKLGKTWTHVN